MSGAKIKGMLEESKVIKKFFWERKCGDRETLWENSCSKSKIKTLEQRVLREATKCHQISWCENFVKKHSFR